MSRRRYLHHLFRDLFVVVASILIAFLLVGGGYIEAFLNATSESLMLSSFLAGAFFTFIFTIAPAGVALVAISQSFPIPMVALFGAVGAMLVDMVILSFVRKDITRDLEGLAQMSFRRHILKAFHFGFLKWFAFAAGLFLIATPFPDEIGLFLLGISRVNSKFLPIVFFLAHFLGIFILLTVAQAL